jgi:hypothetical protein
MPPKSKLPPITKAQALLVKKKKALADDEANDDEHEIAENEVDTAVTDTMWQEAEFVNYWCGDVSATGASGSRDTPSFVDDAATEDDEELAAFYRGYVPPRAIWETDEVNHDDDEVAPDDEAVHEKGNTEEHLEEEDEPEGLILECNQTDDEANVEPPAAEAVVTDKDQSDDEASAIVDEPVPSDSLVDNMLTRLREKWQAESAPPPGEEDDQAARKKSRVRGGRVVQAARLRGLMDEMMNEQMMEVAAAKAKAKAAKKRKRQDT